MENHTDPSITVYEPDSSIKNGYFSLWREIVCELKENRWLTYQLFRRDFFAMHKQSFIGILWIFIMPVVNILIFILLSRARIFNLGVLDVPYPIYAVLGMAFWQILLSQNLFGIGGKMVTAFENEFAKTYGIPYAVASTSGTAAIHTALGALQLLTSIRRRYYNRSLYRTKSFIL